MRHRHYNRVLSILVILPICIAVRASALQVTAQSNLQTVPVGEKVTITITATRSDSLGDPQFAGAAVQAGRSWRLGGQVTQSPARTGAQVVKQWQFELVAVAPDSSRITPVVYLGGDPSLGHRADSILGAPVYLAITAVPERPVWPWIGGALVAVFVPAYLIFRSLRKRKDETFERPAGTPLEEALEMLDAIRAHRREDRSQRYLADLERVLDGYVSRKVGQRLSGRTAAEVVAMVARSVPDEGTLADLEHILRSCAASRFGGVRTSIDTLIELDDQARQTLERMDRQWV